MGLFGWSYPAGCSGPPDEEYAETCPICGEENWDEETDADKYPADPNFCSEAHALEYGEALAESDAQAAFDADALESQMSPSP